MEAEVGAPAAPQSTEPPLARVAEEIVLAGVIDRVGAALVAPRLALRRVSEKAGTDAALLLLLGFLAVNTREAIAAGWLLVADGLAAGGLALATALSRAISMKLAFLFGAGVVIWLGSASPRSFSRGFDQAAISLVPVIFVELVATLLARAVFAAPPAWLKSGSTALAFGWGAVLVVLAIIDSRAARSTST